MNNFDPSKLNIDFTKEIQEKENNNESNAKLEDNNQLENSNEGVKNEETLNKQENIEIDLKKDIKNKEVLNPNDDFSLEEIRKKELENKATILTDPELRPEELKKRDLEEEENTKKEDKKIIFDINIKSIDHIIQKILDNKYDFVVAKPYAEYITIQFKKDSVIKETIYVRFNEYSKIFIKAKNIAKLNLEETTKEQKGEGEHAIGKKSYELIIKTVPCDSGEKLYLKIKSESNKKITKTKKNSISLSKAFGFLAIALFIALILGGAFLTFIVTNAQTVSDVNFFRSLGINLNDINTFLLKLVGIIFSVLLFIETIFLIVNISKSFLTKKEFKKKRNIHIMLSIFFLMVTFLTGTIWMILDKKIKGFPNWQEMSYGDVQIYDNSKLISEKFGKAGALINDNTSIIGPITLKFDLNYYKKKEESKGFEVKKFIWKINDEKIERLTADLIYEYNKKGTYDMKLTVVEKDLKGDIIEKVVSDIPAINIDYIVNKKETKLTNGGKIVEFDASDLHNLGQVQWFFEENLEEPIYVGENFKPSRVFFEDTLIGMYIKSEGKTSENMDKIFIIKSNTGEGIKGDIESQQDIDNDLKFTLKVKSPETDFGNGFIEEFKWIIGEKTITNKADITKLEESSEIVFTFKEYGNKEIKVQLIDSSGKIREINKTIEIPKRLRLKSNLEIINEGEVIEKVEFDKKTSEYFLYDIGVPGKLTFNAKKVKADSFLYSLDSVSWDFDSDGDIDKKGKQVDFEFPIEADYIIDVEYTFVHRRQKDIVVKKKETINIEGIKKEAILDLKVNMESDYVPVIVSFDASESQVKNHNIVKFIYDYGDGTPVEQRDAINKGHKYITHGDYDVKLTVVTEEGKEYSITKKIILKPKPEEVSISSSMKRARVGQTIDFSSSNSQGQIKNYIWDFGDGEISTKANPEHAFQLAGTYKVKLQIEFENRNILSDEMEVTIK